MLSIDAEKLVRVVSHFGLSKHDVTFVSNMPFGFRVGLKLPGLPG